MTFTISKRFDFSAAHALVDLPEDHQCSRFHGHNYIVEITLMSDSLDARGFVRDYGELKTFKQWIDDTLDHRWLGYGRIGRLGEAHKTSYGYYLVHQITQPVFDFNPTAENIARHIYEFAQTLYPEVAIIGISETPKTWAHYSRGSG